MDVVSQEVAYNRLVSFIRRNGGVASAWYCGITNDPRRRIITQHKVNEARGTYHCVKCYTKTSAENVEKKLLARKYSGNTGGGNNNSVYVYVYKKTHNTVDC